MKRGEETLELHTETWNMWKNRYMQYDNAVLPVLREEPEWYSWYSCWLWAEWSGEWIPVRGEIFHGNQTSPKDRPASIQQAAILSKALKWPQCGADHQPSLSTGCNVSPLYLCLPSVPAHRCHEVAFTFTINVDWLQNFKICPLWTYFLPHHRYDRSRAILIFCIMILGAVKLQASHTTQ
jgi:hypothetical protein